VDIKDITVVFGGIFNERILAGTVKYGAVQKLIGGFCAGVFNERIIISYYEFST
jgi:hypothetical protein